MKKSLLLLLLICIAATGFSQGRYGIRGGLNLANQKIKASTMGISASQTLDQIVSFHVGGVAEWPISKSIFFQPSLLLSGKGADFEGEDDMGNPITAELRPFYLDLPLNFIYKHQVQNSSVKLFVGGGPVLSYGIFGKAKSDGEETDAFDENGGFKRFDFGVNMMGGVELQNGMQIAVNFTPGLSNISSIDEPDLDIDWKNKLVSFSLTYFFNQK